MAPEPQPFLAIGARAIDDRPLQTGGYLRVRLWSAGAGWVEATGRVLDSWQRLDWSTEALLGDVVVQTRHGAGWPMSGNTPVLVRMRQQLGWIIESQERGLCLDAVEVPRQWCWGCNVAGRSGRCPSCDAALQASDAPVDATPPRRGVDEWRFVVGGRTVARIAGEIERARRRGAGWECLVRVSAITPLVSTPSGWTPATGVHRLWWFGSRGVMTERQGPCSRCSTLGHRHVVTTTHCDVCGTRTHLWGGRLPEGHARWGNGGGSHPGCGAIVPPGASFCPSCGGAAMGGEVSVRRPVLDP